MATTLAALCELFVRMGVSQAAAIYFIDIEGVNSIEEVANLQVDDVERLCQVFCKPGGMMNNLNPGAVAPALVPHLGTLVSTRAKKNMKLLCYVVMLLGTMLVCLGRLISQGLTWLLSGPMNLSMNMRRTMKMLYQLPSTTGINPAHWSHFRIGYKAVMDRLIFR